MTASIILLEPAQHAVAGQRVAEHIIISQWSCSDHHRTHDKLPSAMSQTPGTFIVIVVVRHLCTCPILTLYV
jgi:hypothetical protein